MKINPELKSALGTYSRALLACIVAQITIVGVPLSGADFAKLANAIWVAFLPVIIRALDPEDPEYGIGSH
jgi:hypothetical protein